MVGTERMSSLAYLSHLHKSRLQRLILTAMLYLGLIFGTLVFALPFVFMLLSSFKANNSEIFTYWYRLPLVWHLNTYLLLFQQNMFGRYFLNTVFVSVITTALGLFVNSLGAFAFARLPFPGKRILFVVLMATLMIPSEAALVPLYLIIHQLKWLNTYQALIVPGIASMFAVFFISQYMETIPSDYDEAARLDGANYWQIYSMIILPLVMPALASIGILSFLGSWNSFLLPLIVISKREFYTLQLGLANLQGTYLTGYAPILAASVVAALPILFVYFIFQKQFIEGIALTGFK
jgi:multiple sugar transport system permease protein